MGTTHSADGTTLGFDTWGDGQPLIMVDGATGYRAVSQLPSQVGELLGTEFRVYAYDRRGRGEQPCQSRPLGRRPERADSRLRQRVRSATRTCTSATALELLSLPQTAAG